MAIEDPNLHLGNPRDSFHFGWTVARLREMGALTVLDIGCWNGWLDMLLAKAGFGVHGLEPVASLVLAARECAKSLGFPDYRVFQGKFNEVPLADKSYDAVACYEVLEHMPFPEVEIAVGRMAQIARKGALVSLPMQEARDNPEHLWTPSEAAINYLFGGRKGFAMEVREHAGTSIPPNYMIRFED